MTTKTPSRLKTWLKRVAFVVAALLTLAALAYAIESYRGRRLWRDYRAQLEAQGEVFDFRRLLPTPVPDDQNFFMTPLLRPFSDYVADEQSRTVRLRDPEGCERVTRLFAWTAQLRSTNSGWLVGRFADLAAFQQQLRDTNSAGGNTAPGLSAEAPRTAQQDLDAARQTNPDSGNPAIKALAARPAGEPAEDLLFLLARNQSELDEIREAARRPAARLNGRYEDGMELLLPQLSALKALARPFHFSALAHLDRANPATAARDILVIFRLGDSLAGEPLLIAALVHIAVSDLAMQPLWEGLTRHQWSESQLIEFESALRRANIIGAMRRCLHGERAFAISMIGGAADVAGIDGARLENPNARAYATLPAPLKYQNQLHIARLFHEQLLPALDPVAGTIDLDRLEDRTLAAWLGGRTPYNVFAVALGPAVSAAARSAARAQATVNLARVAIALERNRLEHGSLPERLEELAPRFLDPVPPDPVTGQPLRYRRDEGDRFTLYSLGMNRQDDGGAVPVTRKNTVPTRSPLGDWVWQNHPVTNTVVVTTAPNAE